MSETPTGRFRWRPAKVDDNGHLLERLAVPMMTHGHDLEVVPMILQQEWTIFKLVDVSAFDGADIYDRDRTEWRDVPVEQDDQG